MGRGGSEAAGDGGNERTVWRHRLDAYRNGLAVNAGFQESREGGPEADRNGKERGRADAASGQGGGLDVRRKAEKEIGLVRARGDGYSLKRDSTNPIRNRKGGLPSYAASPHEKEAIMSEDVLPPALPGAPGPLGPADNGENGEESEPKRRNFTRRGALAAVAVGIASIWFPLPMKAWGLEPLADKREGVASPYDYIPEGHTDWNNPIYALGASNYYYQDKRVSGKDAYLAAAAGILARTKWWTELYYCIEIHPLIRVKDKNVNQKRNHGWVTGPNQDNIIWDGCNFGVPKQDGINPNRGCGYWQSVGYEQCANTTFEEKHYVEYCDFTTEESGTRPWPKAINDEADSEWYFIGDTQYHSGVNPYHQILIRRTVNDRQIELKSSLDAYTFSLTLYPCGNGTADGPYNDGRSSDQCKRNGDFYNQASTEFKSQHIYVKHTAGLAGVNGDTRRVYKLLMKLDNGKALSADGTCQETAGVYVWDYNNETKQNWIVSDYDVSDPDSYPTDSNGTKKLSAIRCVGSANQDMCLNQAYGWSDAGNQDPSNDFVATTVNSDGHRIDVWLYRNDGSMAARWWILIESGDYVLMNDVSGCKLATMRGATDNGTSCVVYDHNCNWTYKRQRWALEPVQFEGTAALRSTVGNESIAVVDNQVECSLPFWQVDQYHSEVPYPCYPADTFYSDSVHYYYTWYADDVEGAHEHVVQAETQVDNEHHDVHATYTPTKADIGKHLSCRIRLKMDCGYFYEGEVWAEFRERVRAKKKVVYHVDEAAFPKPYKESIPAENSWSDSTKKVWVTNTDYPTDTSKPYTAREDWTAEAKRDGHDEAHAICTHADGSDGFDGWYLDSAFTVKFASYAWKDETSEETINLYARNIGHVEFAQGKGSEVAEAFTSELASEPAPLDDACGMPEPIDLVYGVSTALPEIKTAQVWYAPTGGAKFDRPLKAKSGWTDAPDSVGTGFSKLKLLKDTTVYKQWDDSTFDGIDSHDAEEG